MSIADLIKNAEGVPSAFKKETPIGTSVEGKIVEADVQQVTNYEDGRPEFWDDGAPKQQLRIIVETNMRDPQRQDDNGHRAVYVKWWGDPRKALVQAVKQAGDNDVRAGGYFKATYTGDGEPPNPRLNAPKLYAYEYVMPTQAAGLNIGGGEQVNTSTGEVTTPAAQNQLAAQQQAAQQPAQQQAPATGQADPAAVEKAKQLIGLGFQDHEVAGATGLDRTIIASLKNLP